MIKNLDFQPDVAQPIRILSFHLKTPRITIFRIFNHGLRVKLVTKPTGRDCVQDEHTILLMVAAGIHFCTV